MKNGRYCSNGKPDRTQIKVYRPLFFHSFAHTTFLILLPPVLKVMSEHYRDQTIGTVTKTATSSVN